tara:strand:+ start:11 stop:1852 length:1842 start_codon:yes stop_codon:yes gene_type:complete
MAEGKIRVKFEADGSPALISAIKNLNRETKKLAGANGKLGQETERTNRKQKKQEQRTRNLIGTFSVLRSKMLLAAFAVTQFAKPIISLGRNSVMIAANFEALETRLASMTGSVSKASQMMTEFRDIAATTPFAVQDVVEAGVQLRAFGVNAQEMIKPVTDLAAFMGTTATEAASALGRAFAGGAGAADILRERGILQLIKDSQGIKDLSKTTLPEFREALESALLDPTAGIVGATDKLSKTTVGSFSNMRDSAENFLATAAEVSGLKRMFTNIARDITEGTNILTEAIRTETFDELSIKLGEQQADAIDLFVESLAIAKDRGVEFNNDVTIPLTERMKNLREVLNESVKSDFFKGRAFNTATESAYQLREALAHIESTMRSLMLVQDEFIIKQEPIRGTQEDFSNEIKFQKVQVKEVNEERKHEISNLEKLNAFQGRYGSTIQQSARATSVLSDALVNLSKGNKEQTIMSLKLAQASAVADSIAGSAKAFSQGGIVGYITGVAMLAQMMSRVQTIQQQINEAQSFETGGLVGGRRHSQGGTIIEAERGEFVMSRNAVNTIGVENLNRMNQGQSSGGGATIVINNPIVNSDFVENDFAELMREAVRRGADFGIS